MRRRPGTSLRAALLAAGLVALLPAACDATASVPECDRLQTFSCQCFPACQTGYVDIVDSQDAARCKSALASAFAYWQACEGTCGLNCQFGWGACAFSSYESGSLSPGHTCGPAADAATD